MKDAYTRLGLRLAVCGFLTGFVACAPEGECGSDGDCPAGQICDSGSCVGLDPCLGVACPPGEDCQMGVCVPEGCAAATCVDYQDCTTFEGCAPCPDRPAEVCNGRDDDCDAATGEEGLPLDCPAGELCRSGGCCADDCPGEGDSECVGDAAYRHCGQYDDDACLEWGVEQPCADGCVGGFCQGCEPECALAECGDNGCGGSCGSCDEAPDPECADGETLRTSRLPGRCEDGTCAYSHVDMACTNGCTDGRCAACTAATCQGLGYVCGPAEDGCGGLLDCGACGATPEPTCADADTRRTFGDGQCVRGACTYPEQDTPCDNGCRAGACQGCQPRTCLDLGFDCERADDGCGGDLDCGTCGAHASCAANRCTCDHLACRDACCPAGDTCVNDACCTPASCAAKGWECGSGEDGCGGQLDCGDCVNGSCEAGLCRCRFAECGDACCAEGEVCHTGACCLPTSCQTEGWLCGAAEDGCGGDLDCGSCSGCAGQCANHQCQPFSMDHTTCHQGNVWWFDSCDQPEWQQLDCGGQPCVGDACCTPQCDGKCGGAADGCGGTCTSCAGGEVCQGQSCVPCGGVGEVCCSGNVCDAGAVCSGGSCAACGGVGQLCCGGGTCDPGAICGGSLCAACGGDGEPCCAGDQCDNDLHGCGPVSHTCKPHLRVRLSASQPGTGACLDSDYQLRGRWETQPGIVGGGNEATDSYSGEELDAGWVALCAFDGRVAARATRTDCPPPGENFDCAAGHDREGAWHFGTDCAATVAYDDTGASYHSGWLSLCADDSVDAKVELGSSDCGDDGPCCGGGWTKIASWHVGSGCDGAGDTIHGESGDNSYAGWACLCVR